ncbi:MAG: peptidylprolyl isomerase [Rubrivivax sp.]|nr:MAG: peptidylprolyl isomerase [Rubrivivax sp.]
MKSTLSRRGALLAASVIALSLAACGGGGGSSGGGDTPPPSTPTPPAPGSVAITVTHKVRLTTTQGVIELGLDRTHAPITVDNFLKYVNDGFYNNTVFHRVISNFVIQGGGVARNAAGALQEKTPTYPAITLESQTGLSNVRGTLAMARTTLPNSATAQFFINVVDNNGTGGNTNLNYQSAANPGYAVFGKVEVGMDVVDKIKAVSTNGDIGGNVPLADVIVTKAEVLQ